ncbi:MFP1 attachment factor 1-like [Chenopodium quinoa]|uniref:MFP1 attachment factor 1-like n=1 Tax=Chenopodium quinoa TaxID=63459 RepID=UPI000B76BF5A|nr:MFP1 attachment factor 1-like [Chenopodium quinoa]
MSDTAADETPVAGEMLNTADTEQHPPHSSDNLSEKMEKMNISGSSFSIWPPTQRTRDAVINRLIETLSTPSVLSKRYGSLLPDEASSTAISIEEEAYNAAAASSAPASSATASSIDEGIEILQVYSKEISKRMLDAVKSRAAPPSDVSTAPESDRATVASEEVSSFVDNESSS